MIDFNRQRKLLYPLALLAAFVLVAAASEAIFTRYFQHSGEALWKLEGNDKEEGNNGKVNGENENGEMEDYLKKQKAERLKEIFGQDTVNLMFLGIDRTWDRERGGRDQFFPDTILIVSLDLEENEVHLVNVLRDTFAYIAEAEVYDRISNAYTYGYHMSDYGDPDLHGVEVMQESLRHFLGGVPLHNYIAVDLDGAAEIVDALGGVEYELEEPLRDDFGEGEVIVPEGDRELEGREFLYLLQYRGSSCDRDRVERQQEIMLEVLRQFKEDTRLEQVPRVYSVLRRNIKTDLSTEKIGALTDYITLLSTDNYHSHVFRGDMVVSLRDNREILKVVVDESHRRELIKEVFGLEVSRRRGIRPVKNRPLREGESFSEFPSPGLRSDVIEREFSY